MALVSYSDSEEEEEGQQKAFAPSSRPPPSKKRRTSTGSCTSQDQTQDKVASHANSPPPPLPASFHSLYSSSVRVSASDDPALHGGRKRITPHVTGNWPTHVYLEWFPEPHEHNLLTRLIHATVKASPNTEAGEVHSSAVHKSLGLSSSPTDTAIHSLLETPLGVPLPLHVSLSAPLVLRTENKQSFLNALVEAITPIAKTLKSGLIVSPDDLYWHPNEDGSRSFLVFRVLEHLGGSSACGGAQADEQSSQGREKEKKWESRQHDRFDEERKHGRVEKEKERRAEGQAEEQQQQQQQEELQKEHAAIDQPGKSSLEKKQRQLPTTASTSGLGLGKPNHENGEMRRAAGPNSRLNDLLRANNRIAKAFGQPELYVANSSREQPSPSLRNRHQTRTAPAKPTEGRGDFSGSFHMSIAWALSIPTPARASPVAKTKNSPQTNMEKCDIQQAAEQGIPGSNTKHKHTWTTGPEVSEAMSMVQKLRIRFDEVKIRIGRDVTSVPFGNASRPKSKMTLF